ncbi:hypothetical protein C8R44DRAFT_753154 [Mycena epipterygia]|nr:hypothetical protein C8R44DRAFT_753154 [Mycena epipterygia]
MGDGERLYYRRRQQSYVPFSPRSRGFFYYHAEASTPLETSIRFRLTLDSTSSVFARGQDFLARCGLPWQIPLPQIAEQAGYSKIRQQLLHEILVTEEDLAHCRAVFRGQRTMPQYTLFGLDSIFVVNFSSPITLHAVGHTLHKFCIHLFLDRDQRGGDDNRLYPWTGSALARFEASTQPEHAGRRVINLRIVKIVQTASRTIEGYDGRVREPAEGELVPLPILSPTPEPWAYDIDDESKAQSGVAAALRVLWHNSGLP